MDLRLPPECWGISEAVITLISLHHYIDTHGCQIDGQSRAWMSKYYYYVFGTRNIYYKWKVLYKILLTSGLRLLSIKVINYSLVRMPVSIRVHVELYKFSYLVNLVCLMSQ